jgi:hypothetical protein
MKTITLSLVAAVALLLSGCTPQELADASTTHQPVIIIVE